MLRMMTRLIGLLILSCFAWHAFASDFDQNERVTKFYSKIVVNPDASIDVNEVIAVYVNGTIIKHGIVRWLPERYVDSYGVKHHVHYHMTTLLMNDVNSHYRLENQDSDYVVYVGDKNILLPAGFYTYSLQYHVDNAVNFFKDGDEIYWNVTGNHWNFPIKKVIATVQLPNGATIMNYSGYTGSVGAKGKDYITQTLSGNQIQFTTTRPLGIDEGLTVAVIFPKGFVHQPTWEMSLREQMDTWEWLLVGITLLATVYLIAVKFLFAMGPPRGTIIPLFQPPENLSPAAVRYIRHMGFDMKIFTAAIVDLAVQKILMINKMKNTFTLAKNSVDLRQLREDEKVVATKIFADGPSVALKQQNYATIAATKNALASDLKTTYKNKYFVTNAYYLWPSILLTIVAFGIAIVTANVASDALGGMVWLSFWTFGCSLLLVKAYTSIKQITLGFSNVITAIFYIMIAVVFLAGEVLGLVSLSETISMFTIPLLFILVVLNIAFYYMLKVPTVEGRKIMDAIDGFKLFLTTTEKDRLEKLNPPAQTPELFESYLPYAIALNVENEWGERFNVVLHDAGIDPSAYQPVWYSGAVWTSASLAAFPVLLSGGLGSSLASASVSSAAGSGGGFSGGGGGGGGGGGW